MEGIKRFFSRLFKVSLVIIVGFAVLGAAYVSGQLPSRIELREIEKIIHVPEPEMGRDELINQAPSVGMPRIVAAVLLEQEDGGRYRKNAKRCEWGSSEWLERARKIEPKDKEQQDAYRCSYGPFQVAGWHAVRYGLVWSDLLVPRNNLEVAGAVWGNCYEHALKRKGLKDEWAVFWDSFRCYNGSGPAAEAYANRAMDHLARIAVNDVLSREGYRKGKHVPSS